MPGAPKPPRKLTREVPEDAVEQEIFATSIKVINLLAPCYKGNKTGLTTPPATRATRPA